MRIIHEISLFVTNGINDWVSSLSYTEGALINENYAKYWCCISNVILAEKNFNVIH